MIPQCDCVWFENREIVCDEAIFEVGAIFSMGVLTVLAKDRGHTGHSIWGTIIGLLNFRMYSITTALFPQWLRGFGLRMGGFRRSRDWARLVVGAPFRRGGGVMQCDIMPVSRYGYSIEARCQWQTGVNRCEAE